MRICFFAPVSGREVLDRVEFYRQDLKILRDLGHEVYVATRASELRGADVYFVWWWTWAFLPLAIARLVGRPVIVTGVFDIWAFDARSWLQRTLLRWALRAADTNVFISKLERDEVPARFRVTRPMYSPCIVDSDMYRPGTSPREPFLLTVGWLQGSNADRKGIPLTLRAFALLRDTRPKLRLVVAGAHGSALESLQTLTRELGVDTSVRFAGAVSADEKIRLMQTCAAYLQPSTFEGFGVAVLEAMACGAPVVASAAGALPEVIGQAGITLVEPTPETIAAAVASVLDDPTTADELATLARERAMTVFTFARRRADIAAALALVGARSSIA